MLKLQSAMEYLTTYGWAILIIGIALVVIFTLVGSGATQPPQECLLPAGFSCLNYYMTQNGVLQLNLLQSTQYPISITAVGCNNPESVSMMNSANQILFHTANVPIGANDSFSVQCFTNTTAYFGKIDSVYSGYVIINYTNAYTNFPNTIYGRLVVKVIK